METLQAKRPSRQSKVGMVSALTASLGRGQVYKNAWPQARTRELPDDPASAVVWLPACLRLTCAIANRNGRGWRGRAVFSPRADVVYAISPPSLRRATRDGWSALSTGLSSRSCLFATDPASRPETPGQALGLENAIDTTCVAGTEVAISGYPLRNRARLPVCAPTSLRLAGVTF